MENASKALLIAGAILLVIAIIAVGMYVFNMASGVTQGTAQQMDAMEIQAFNSQFESYAGDKVGGTEVKALISRVIANNSTYAEDTARLVEVSLEIETGVVPGGATPVPATDVIANISAIKISTTAKYKVELELGTGASNGLVHTIKLTKIT